MVSAQQDASWSHHPPPTAPCAPPAWRPTT